MSITTQTSAESKSAEAAADMQVVFASIVHFGLVGDMGVPISEVQVTDVAVIVLGVVALVLLHLFFATEISNAVFVSALDITASRCHGEGRWGSLRLEMVLSTSIVECHFESEVKDRERESITTVEKESF
jgi:hypothetical protein